MPKTFQKLQRSILRKLESGQKIIEQGITFERLANGDGIFSINVMVDRRRIHRVVGKESDGTTRTQAESLIEKLKQDAKQGRLNLPKGRKTSLGFAEASQNYLRKLNEEGGKDLIMKERRLRLHLVPFFKDMPLFQMSNFDVERYKKHRLAQKPSQGTINRELAALSHLFTKAVEWKWIDKRPATIRRFKEEQSRITYLTVEQIRRLIEASKHDQNPQVYPFIVIGLETAMRRMEILSIQIRNIDLGRKMIYIPEGKTGSREQPITNHLAEFLEDYLKTTKPKQKWLFPSPKSSTGHTTNIEKAFKRVVQEAGLDAKQVVRHTLRHTAITHLVQAGVDLPTVKRISGHKTLQMVERYSHQNGAHIQAAMDKLDQRYRQIS